MVKIIYRLGGFKIVSVPYTNTYILFTLNMEDQEYLHILLLSHVGDAWIKVCKNVYFLTARIFMMPEVCHSVLDVK